jgi:hypothetical protein
MFSKMAGSAQRGPVRAALPSYQTLTEVATATLWREGLAARDQQDRWAKQIDSVVNKTFLIFTMNKTMPQLVKLNETWNNANMSGNLTKLDKYNWMVKTINMWNENKPMKDDKKDRMNNTVTMPSIDQNMT